MLLLELDTTRKGQVDENNRTKLNVSKKSSIYKVKAICNSTVYIRELTGYLSKFYYLVF